jgi:hypothetical protein
MIHHVFYALVGASSLWQVRERSKLIVDPIWFVFNEYIRQSGEQNRTERQLQSLLSNRFWPFAQEVIDSIHLKS